MLPQFLWRCLTDRTMSPETYSELRWSFFRKSLRVSVVCFGKISVLDIKSISECTSQVNLDVQLLSISSPIFLTWIPIKHLKEIFFAEMASGIQLPAISKVKFHLRCLTVFWMYFLIQLWCCFTISIIIPVHLFILLFYHSLFLSYLL